MVVRKKTEVQVVFKNKLSLRVVHSFLDAFRTIHRTMLLLSKTAKVFNVKLLSEDADTEVNKYIKKSFSGFTYTKYHQDHALITELYILLQLLCNGEIK